MYKLDLKVIEAKNILREEKISDPLVEVGIRGPMHPIFKSNFVSQTVNPTWDQVFVLSAHNPDEFLVMRIVDARTGELMGETEIALGPYLNQGPKDFWVSLFLHRHQRKGFLFHKRKETDEAWLRTPGDVHVQIAWSPIDEAQLQTSQLNQQPSSFQQPLTGQQPQKEFLLKLLNHSNSPTFLNLLWGRWNSQLSRNHWDSLPSNLPLSVNKVCFLPLRNPRLPFRPPLQLPSLPLIPTSKNLLFSPL